MKVFKKIDPNSIYYTPYEVHKKYTVVDGTTDDTDGTEGVTRYVGLYRYDTSEIYSLNDRTNDVALNAMSDKNNNTYYDYIVHASMDHLFYRYFLDKSTFTFETPSIGEQRELHKKIIVFSVPRNMFGEGIQKQSLFVTHSAGLGEELLTNNDFFNGSYSWNSNNYTVFSNTGSIFLTTPLSDSNSLQQYNVELEADTRYLATIKIGRNNLNQSSANISFSIDIPNSGSITKVYQPSVFNLDSNTVEEVFYNSNGASSVATFSIDLNPSNNIAVQFTDISLRKIGEKRYLQEDSTGNIYDVAMKASSETLKTAIDNNQIGYWQFIDGYKQYKMNDPDTKFVRDYTIYRNHGKASNVIYNDGIYGTKATFGYVNIIQSIIGKDETHNVSSSANVSVVTSGYVLYDKIDNQSIFDHQAYKYNSAVVGNDYIQYNLSSTNSSSLYEISLLSKTNSTSSTDPQLGVYLYSGSLSETPTGAGVAVYTSSLAPTWKYDKFYFTGSAYVNKLVIDFNSSNNLNQDIYVGNVQLKEVKPFSYVRINHLKEYNQFLKAHNQYSMVMNVDIPKYQTDLRHDTNIILCKDGRQLVPPFNYNYTGSVDLPKLKPYPFKVEVYNQNTFNNGKIKASMYDGQNIKYVTSSQAYNDYSNHTIWVQKTDTQFELYVDGILQGSVANYDKSNTIHNELDMFIGSRGDKYYSFNGGVDELRLMSGSMSAANILSYHNYQMSESFNYNVGNMFKDTGHFAFTSPYKDYQYIGEYTGSIGYSLSFKNTIKREEVEVICTAEPGEFNKTLNVTAVDEYDLNLSYNRSFVSHSAFHPYVTTIGLYNQVGELLAIAKVSRPIKRTDEYEQNYIVRFDM